MNEPAKSPKIVRRGYVSERGPFELNANPKVKTPDFTVDIDEEAVLARFEYSALAEKCGEDAARNKVLEMARIYRRGAVTTPLLVQEGKTGMSLAHIWFGANFELFRHSHPGHGDCLYVVTAGELNMGSRKLGPGSTLFVPNGQPYKYTAGPAGAEVLEFRAGGGVPDVPDVFLDERTLDAMDKLIRSYKENSPGWKPPENIGDVAFLAKKLDAADPDPV